MTQIRTKVVILIFLPLILANISALADFQVITNGGFELTGGTGTNLWQPGWLEGSLGAAVAAPVPIGGSRSPVLVRATGTAADLYQVINPSMTGAWLSDWVFDMDFACSNPGGSGANRSFALVLGQYAYGASAAGAINIKVVDTDNNGLGELQVFNQFSGGGVFVTAFTNLVSFTTNFASLKVNHLRIIGHYTNSPPNYDLILVNVAGVTNTVLGQTNWQGSIPNSTNGVWLIQNGTANLVTGASNVVDNFSLTVAKTAGVAPSISGSGQPVGVTVYQGVANVSFSVQVSGTTPSYQWYVNGTNSGNILSGATSSTLILSNVTVAMSGNSYILQASNSLGVVWSSNATLTVLAPFNTAEMTNIWNLAPDSAVYLGVGNAERGMAYDPVSSNLLLVSRLSDNSGTATNGTIVALDPATGAFKYFISSNNVDLTIPGQTVGMNLIGVSDDGGVYVGNLSVNAASSPYKLWYWTNANASAVVSGTVYSGDPGSPNFTGLRWGDTLALRGTSINLQVLISPSTGTNVALLSTSSGGNLTNQMLAISGVPSGFAQAALAFGPGTNTFWAKGTGTNGLYLVQFNLAAGTGAVLKAYPTSIAPLTLFGIGGDRKGRWLAGFSTETAGHTACLYSLDSSNNLVLADQEVFATINLNQLTGNLETGASVFGGSNLFVLDSNNGIKAFSDSKFENHAPVAVNITAGAQSGVPVTLQVVGGKYAPADIDGDSLFISAAQNPSDQGGTVITDGTNLTYIALNSFTGADSFTYTVSDGAGGTTVARVTVNVTNNNQGQGYNQINAQVIGGDAVLTYLGIPGRSYALDETHSLSTPITWTPVVTNQAAIDGLINYTNTPSGGLDFYRTRYVQ